jgi:hypothetical protein
LQDGLSHEGAVGPNEIEYRSLDRPSISVETLDLEAAMPGFAARQIEQAFWMPTSVLNFEGSNI